jgi:methyltransferase (TIGR00027 family)
VPADPEEEVNTIGATALGIARARAQESRRQDRLFDDPYAERFVIAGARDTPVTGALAGESEQAREAWEFLSHHVAIRTRFFDDYLAAATAAGLRQVVLVAVGLDARGIRLAWPEGVRVFELDQGPVLAFKERVLAGHRGPAPRTPVAVDLREDWAAALVRAGFEPAQPAAWLVEGVLPALTDADSDRLLARLSELSAPGSRLAYEYTGDTRRIRPILEAIDPSLIGLWKGGPTGDPTAWLEGHGWEPEVLDQVDVARGYDRRTPERFASGDWPQPRLISARR